LWQIDEQQGFDKNSGGLRSLPTWLLQVFGRQRGKLHGCTWLMDINMH
jgi:hypothetical protein